MAPDNHSLYLSSSQASFYSTALKTLISVSTVILLGLIVAYHALEVQVSLSGRRKERNFIMLAAFVHRLRAFSFWQPQMMLDDSKVLVVHSFI